MGREFAPRELILVAHHHLHGPVILPVRVIGAPDQENIFRGKVTVDVNRGFAGIYKIGALQEGPPPSEEVKSLTNFIRSLGVVFFTLIV